MNIACTKQREYFNDKFSILSDTKWLVLVVVILKYCPPHDPWINPGSTRSLRAHTLHAPCNCFIVQLGHMLSMTVTYTRTRLSRVHEQKLHAYKYIVDMVDGCGYDGQLKYTICDACRPYHSISSILEPVFSQL